jgi:prepilin-type N-terminal cleavage/methylation domain-containing protein
MFHFKYNQKGFTLLEAMVAIAIFTIIMVIGISALLNVSSTNKKTQNLRTIIDNLSFSMEDMARNFRLGSNFHCIDDGVVTNPDLLITPQDCPDQYTDPHNGVGAVALEPMLGKIADTIPGPGSSTHSDDQVVYQLAYSTVPGYTNYCVLQKSTNGGANFFDMTPPPPEVLIDCERSGFNVLDTGSDSASIFAPAPRVLIRLSGKIEYKQTVTPFELQTSATQRTVSIITTP